jgi:oligoribonuclease
VTDLRDDLLCWLDLEMTGLDPQLDSILEIATLLTTSELEIVAQGPEIVLHAGEEQLQRMIPIVREMHEKSGLTERSRRAATGVRDAERETLAFLRQHCKPGTAPLCGNSIWCDRMFLKLHMPELDKFLHYRVIDVSSFKECATRWNIHAIGGAPRKGDKHRALDDIKDSVEELRHYRDRWLAPKKVKPPARAPGAPAAPAAPSESS